MGSTSAQICFGYKLPCLSSVLRHNPADYLHSVQAHQAHGCTCGVTDLQTHKNLHTRRVTKIQTIALYYVPSSGDGWLLICPFFFFVGLVAFFPLLKLSFIMTVLPFLFSAATPALSWFTHTSLCFSVLQFVFFYKVSLQFLLELKRLKLNKSTHRGKGGQSWQIT